MRIVAHVNQKSTLKSECLLSSCWCNNILVWIIKLKKNQGGKNFTLVARQDCCTLTVHGSHMLMKIATRDTREPHVNLDPFTVNAAR